jgi:hypothetical protein
VITVYGTGDPKLLSGGISEALITTQLGLSVAIPTLLLGNLLSGWGEQIRSGMERAALQVALFAEPAETALPVASSVAVVSLSEGNGNGGSISGRVTLSASEPGEGEVS